MLRYFETKSVICCDEAAHTEGRAMKQVIEGYAILPPDKEDLQHYDLYSSFTSLPEHSWLKFCYPSLRREGFEDDGYKAQKVKLTVETIE